MFAYEEAVFIYTLISVRFRTVSFFMVGICIRKTLFGYLFIFVHLLVIDFDECRVSLQALKWACNDVQNIIFLGLSQSPAFDDFSLIYFRHNYLQESSSFFFVLRMFFC